MNRIIILTILISLIVFSSKISILGQSNDPVEPLIYPFGTIGNNNPYIIWKDIYNKRDPGSGIQYRITIKEENTNKKSSYIILPKLYYKFFYLYRIPDLLPDNKYQFTIERLIDKNPINSRYYYYLRYPISRKFTLNSADKNRIDTLPPEYLIRYLYIDRNNSITNRNNLLFYASSGTIAFGVGWLFYTVLDYGIISKIIYYICFTSSAFGISASGYYGYKYIAKKRELNKILDIGSKIKIKAGVIEKSVNAEAELSF